MVVGRRQRLKMQVIAKERNKKQNEIARGYEFPINTPFRQFGSEGQAKNTNEDKNQNQGRDRTKICRCRHGNAISAKI